MIRISDKLQLLVSTFGSQAIRIGTIFVLARLIGPVSTGIYGMLLAVTGVIMSLNDFSIPLSQIQIREFDEETVYDTAMALSIALYIFYGAGTIVGGIYLAHHYANPQFLGIAAILSLANLMGAIYNVQLAHLNRNLRFRAEGMQNLIFSISAAGSCIIFALLGWDVYALVLQLLVGQLVANIFISFKIPFHFPRKASLIAAKQFFRLGAPVSLSACVGNVEGSIVSIFIKTVGGFEGIGIWNRAIQIQALFSQNAMAGFHRVAYPLLCKAAGDKERSRELFVRVTVTMMLASAFLMVLLGCDSQDMIRIVLGSKWIQTTPLLRITAFAIPAGGLTAVAYLALLASGNPGSLLRTSILNFIFFIPAVFICRRWGLTGLAICWATSRYFIGITAFEKARHQFAATIMSVAVPVGSILIVALAAVVLAMRCVSALPPTLPLLPRFVLANAIGAGTFFIGVLMVRRDALVYAIKMARGKKKSIQPAMEMPAAAVTLADSIVRGQDPESRN